MIDLSKEDKCAECGHLRGVHQDPGSKARWQCVGAGNPVEDFCRCGGFVEPEKKP